MRIAFLVASLCLLPISAPSAPANSPLSQDLAAKLRKVMEAIFRLDYPAAEQACDQLIREQPDNPVGYVYRARVYWSEALSQARLLSVERMSSMDLFSDSPRFRATVAQQTKERFDRASKEAVARAQKWSKAYPKDPLGDFLLGAAFQSKAGYQFSIEGERLQAAKYSNASYDLNRRLVHAYPEFADARVVTGAVNAINASLTLWLRFLGAMGGYYGNWDKGREDLEIAAARAQIASDDARTLLAIMYVRDSRYEQAIATLQELHQRYPQNYLVHLDIAAAYLLLNRPKEAVKAYNEILDQHYKGLDPTAVVNRLGVAARISGNLGESEKWLRQAALGGGTQTHTTTISYLELGKTLDLQGKRKDAIAQYKLVVAADDFLESRKEAKTLIAKAYDGSDDAGSAGGLLTLR